MCQPFHQSILLQLRNIISLREKKNSHASNYVLAKTLYILKGLYYNTIAKYTCKFPLETCMVTLGKD